VNVTVVVLPFCTIVGPTLLQLGSNTLLPPFAMAKKVAKLPVVMVCAKLAPLRRFGKSE